MAKIIFLVTILRLYLPFRYNFYYGTTLKNSKTTYFS
ncbi:MAG: hypothetical protein K0S12_272, partial [Bacteroidetes bacterium]|nr:hypothetical protein [Bacteroidota bacterium]